MQVETASVTTASDFRKLPEGTRAQLIEGELLMSPAPSVQHQRIVARLLILLSKYVEEHQLGEVLPAPVDVYLEPGSVSQPDLIFISKARAAIVRDVLEGPPDLVVEVLSPGTAYYDLKKKRRVYERTGVKEYWIADPEEKSIEVLVNSPDGFSLNNRAEGSGTIRSVLLSGLSLDITPIFS